MQEKASAARPATWRNRTRAMKNAKYLQKVAPHIIPAVEPREGFSSLIHADILSKVHRFKHNAVELRAHPALAEFLRDNKLPALRRPARDGLFNGAFHFVRVTFHTPGGDFSFANSDMNRMVEYARHCIVPISQYALQYGPNTPSVSATVLTYTANMGSASFNDSDLRGWVSDIVSANSLPADACIVVPVPSSISGADVGGNSGYHDKADNAYVVFGVNASGLTLDDTADVYAMVISHELGEVVVDPTADWSVGEVGDPCDLNCLGGAFYRAYFDAFDNYLGTNKQTPPGGFTYTYYICPVVKPDGIAHSSSDCHATDEDCNYAPVHQDFYFTVDKSTFGRDEVQDNSSYPNAFWLILEGFTPNGIATAMPSLSGAFQTDIPGLAINPGTPVFELGTDPSTADTPQRIRFGYDLQFSTGSLTAFPAVGASPVQKLLAASITIRGRLLDYAPATLFELIAGADPYFTNVNPSAGNDFWLSQDLRVFTATPGANDTPVTGAPAMGSDNTAGAFTYIQDLLTYLNGNFNDPSGSDPFTSAFPGQGDALDSDSSVTPKTGSRNNYNFAVARVRLRGTAGPSGQAENVKVFFRLWSTQTADTDYQTGSTYNSHNDAAGLPDAPQVGADHHTLPFFATGNLSGNTDYGAGGPNNRTITIPSGDAVWAYFGCFLNLYDSGNVIDGRQIQQWLNGTHHCLVAQIAYDGAPIINSGGVTMSPENSDKLAQRNLQVTTSDNPGGPAAHRIPQTFDVRPSRPLTPVPGGLGDYPDELMIDWGNTPVGAAAHIYWPQVAAADVLKLAARLYSTHTLSAIETNTVQCLVTGGVTYIPIPAATGPNFAGLLTVDLPTTVVKGQEFNILVRRIATRRYAREVVGRDDQIAVMVSAKKNVRNWRYVTGTFQVKIPVSDKEGMLLPEENTLAIMKWRLLHMDTGNRWYKVLQRYITYLSGRVDGLGGNSAGVKPSLDGVPLPTHFPNLKPGVEYTGKVCEIVFDCFGDFEGFTLCGCSDRRLFKSKEKAIGDLALRACKDRLTISVLVDGKCHDKICKLIVRY